jgi:hypothetical protein
MMKKKYVKPAVRKVSLAVKETVLGTCKSGVTDPKDTQFGGDCKANLCYS